MAYEIPIVVRDRCCGGGCDGVTADTATCWEVYEPGRSLETNNRFWMFPNDGIVRNALNNGAYKWTPYDSPYETDCFATGMGDPQTHVSGAALRKVSWEKMAGCGPYLLTGHFGDDPVISTATASTTEQPNDLRWFETLGYVKATSPGFWTLRPCTRPYYLAEDGPTCLYVDREMFKTQVPVVIESLTNSNCNITLGYSDLVGQLDGVNGGVITWLISADQVNITVTYQKGANTYTGTFPFVRNWWLNILDLYDERGNVAFIYDCSQIPCEYELSCWPDLCPCLVDGSTDPPILHREIYADISGEHTETGLVLQPSIDQSSYQWTGGVSDAVTILCQNSGLDPYYVAVSLGPDSYFGSIPANGLACDGSELADEIISCGGITIRLYTT